MKTPLSVALITLCICFCTRANAKRLPLPVITPIIKDGVSYLPQYEFGLVKTDKYQIAYITATDIASKKELWREKIFSVMRDENLELDVQDVYVKSLILKKDSIIAYDEKGHYISIDINTKDVKPKNIIYHNRESYRLIVVFISGLLVTPFLIYFLISFTWSRIALGLLKTQPLSPLKDSINCGIILSLLQYISANGWIYLMADTSTWQFYLWQCALLWLFCFFLFYSKKLSVDPSHLKPLVLTFFWCLIGAIAFYYSINLYLGLVNNVEFP